MRRERFFSSRLTHIESATFRAGYVFFPGVKRASSRRQIKDILAEQVSPHAHVAKNAEASDGHLTFSDYVLLYAHKKDARSVPDVKTGRTKTVYKNMSTWTWKLNGKALMS